MPGLPLFFTDASGVAELTHKPLPGLYLGDDTFLGEGIWLDQGVAEAFAEQPFLENVGIVYPVTTTPAEATMAMPGLPTFGEIIEIVDTVPAVALMSMPAFGGQDLVYPVTTTPAIATMPMPGTSGSLPVVIIPSVRELPPLRVHIDVQTPAGKHFRWGSDEPDPTNVPTGIRFSDTMPGGFETFDCTLPRKSSRAGADLEPFSTIKVVGAGGEPAWEGRLERTPRASGDQVSVSPSAVGYQAALDDEKSAQMIYVDRDLSRWGQMSNLRRNDLNGGGFWQLGDGSVAPADPSGVPELGLIHHGPWTESRPLAESWYDAGSGTRIALVYYAWRKSATIGLPDGNFSWSVGMTTDSQGASVQATSNLNSAGPGSGFFSANTTDRRFAYVQFYYGIIPAGGDVDYSINWTCLAVYGDHGLPRYGEATATEAPGLLASDVVKHAVGRWAPQLNTSGVSPSAFVIPHLLFADPTSASEIVKGASRFGLQDWAVWQDKTFWWHDQGVHSRFWRTRVGPSQLEETGPSSDRVYESVIVQYQDVDGSTKTVGPPGARTDWEEPSLKDLDPENPANKAGMTRRALLTMGISARDPFTNRPSAPIEIGRRFLEEQKLLDKSGRARILGHVESDRGVVYPYWAPRAGDYISFTDASDTSYRRIVRSDKDHASRTCGLDLDAPPESLQALLERFGVGIVDLGFN